MEATRVRVAVGLLPDLVGVVAGDLLWSLVPELLRTSLATLADGLTALLGPGALPLVLAGLAAAQWARQVRDGAALARMVRARIL